ncbi:MAG TPA: polysaccharide biosynthesis protein [Firmicutes bacterium]|nr:polysaccharide biosynthesis protein [Candidatus Fermentithermobacillaceae bacterium]
MRTMLILRKVYLLILDIVLVNFAALAGLYLRFDGNVAPRYLDMYLRVAPAHTAITIALFAFLGLYSWVLRYASIDEMLGVAAGSMGSAVSLFVLTRIPPAQGFPRSVPIIAGVLVLILSGGVRLSVRLYLRITQKLAANGRSIRVLIVGAGDAGAMLARELAKPEAGDRKAVGFIDDDPAKIGAVMLGIKVLGDRKAIPEIVRSLDVDEVILAMPSAPAHVLKETVQICEGLGVRIRAIPKLLDIAGKAFSLNMVRDIDIEDLLGRSEVKLETEKIRDYLSGKRVLVTGAGGSIGSEICRQVARFGPDKLIMLGHGENSIFTTRMTLGFDFPDLKVETVIADVRDSARIRDVFAIHRPEVVFHAAAHKHVPLMEENMVEAIKTNVFGTYNVAKAALLYEAEKFVMISTDKAVNPTSVMGVSKRVAEMLVQSMNARSKKTQFVSVRFGNVLGSSGSVIPVFREQIARGGPVTVTHPDMRRYFMTIREAVLLVLQAGTMGHGGEVFVLDMGEPVKIVDLAEQMIRLSGRTPYTDIPIVFTGVRPGEKLFEELLTAEEGTTATHHTQIFIAKQKPLPLEWFEDCLRKLEREVFPPDYRCRLFDTDEAESDLSEALCQTAASETDSLKEPPYSKARSDSRPRPWADGRDRFLGDESRRHRGDERDRLVLAGREQDIIRILKEMVPSYNPGYTAEPAKKRRGVS